MNLAQPGVARALPPVGLASAGMAMLCAAPCLWLAWHYPLSAPLAVVTCGAVAAVAARWPLQGLAALPALLPAIGWMPWTGWLTFEEFDLAILAVAAGGYAHQAIRHQLQPGGLQTGPALLQWLLLLAFAAALCLSMVRGFDDAGGFVWGWWQGYYEPMNSLRLAKSFAFALVLLPLWLAQWRIAANRAASAWGAGLGAGLLVVALLALWERWAYTGLANFSSDYRTTALFWEMHVGGAAFDGFLALTLPFAVRELLKADSGWRWALSALAAVLGAYACLTTFSRGVYLAVPLGLTVMGGLQALTTRRARGRGEALPGGHGSVWPAVLICGLFATSAAAMFPTSGYRGVLAVFGAFALVLPMAGWWRPLSGRTLIAGLILGAGLSPLALLLASLLPKGPYLVYGAAWLGGAALVVWLRVRQGTSAASWAGAALLVLWLAQWAAIPVVATHWGGPSARWPAFGGCLLVAALGVAGSRGAQPRWPESLRWQGTVLGALFAVFVCVGILMGGAYMGDRFATGDRDMNERLRHWGRALSLLNDPLSWAFGKGTGRYVANHFLSGKLQDQVGDYRLVQEDEAQHLVLSAGKHTQGWGELFRVSQRVDPFTGTVTVRLDARSAEAAALHLEICRKHLLYDDGGCTIGKVAVKALPGQWQALEVKLPGRGLGHGDFFAPRFITFSVAVERAGRRVELDNLRATDQAGRALLVNGDFERGMAHWFFSSDRHHMPWHMKNMLLHVLFEQGVVGLVLFSALLSAAFWRVTGGMARDHALAPALAGSMLGFFVIGLFDSLLDVPRVSFLFYLTVSMALLLPSGSPTTRRAAPTRL